MFTLLKPAKIAKAVLLEKLRFFAKDHRQITFVKPN